MKTALKISSILALAAQWLGAGFAVGWLDFGYGRLKTAGPQR